jgi:DNA processing protein
VAFRRLLARYGSAAAALDALPSLARAGGRPAPAAIPPADEALRELHAVSRLGATMSFAGGPDYPPLLALLDDAPPVLTVLGDPGLLADRAVALVGGRNASANGQRVAEGLAAELAGSLVVVSGLARGIDAAAHIGALQTGRTVAAVAGGVDLPYPPEHMDLQRRIAESGAVVSEAPLGTSPQARHFPRRNRIIAGLSLGVVVV